MYIIYNNNSNNNNYYNYYYYLDHIWTMPYQFHSIPAMDLAFFRNFSGDPHAQWSHHDQELRAEGGRLS